MCLFVTGPSAAEEPVKQKTEDGIEVGKMSALRKIVPSEYVEAQALEQYNGLKQQAQQQGALAPDNDPQLKRLRGVAQRLVPHAARWNPEAAQWQWEVNLIGSKQLNAFCMPGGKIAFFTGLIDGLKLTDDEIAMVMGHEMAHALREHGRNRVDKGTALKLGASVASSLLGLKDVGQTVMNQGAQLMFLKFSRDDEMEADVAGLDLAARAGYDPRAGVALWKKMAIVSKGAPPQWLSTHPAGTNRIAQIRSRLPQVMPLYARTRNTAVNKLPPYRTNVPQIAAVE
jgi:predicted Zn-dependent protease